MDEIHRQHVSASSDRPGSGHCATRQPQLNTTIIGPCCGCSTCLCGNNNVAGSNADSGRDTRPSSSQDGLVERFSTINITVNCCTCCPNGASVVEHVVEVEPGHGAGGLNQPRCGPFEQTPSGHFELSGDRMMSSTGGSILCRVSREAHPVGTQTSANRSPAATRPHSPLRVIIRQYPGSNTSHVFAHTGQWIDSNFGHVGLDDGYAPGEPYRSSRGSPNLPDNLGQLFDIEGARTIYPTDLNMD